MSAELDTVVEHAHPLDAATAWVDIQEPAIKMTELIAASQFVPEAIRGNRGAVFSSIMLGLELGVGPMTTLANVHVINGKATPSSELMRALIFRAGHEMTFIESTTERCVVECRRRGTQHVSRFVYTMDDAKRAKLLNKGPWQADPRAMLIARCSSLAARAMFPDVIIGLPPDIDDVDEVDEVERPPAPTAKISRRRRTSEPEPEPETVTVEVIDAVVVDETTGEILDEVDEVTPATQLRTDAQSRQLFALLNKCDYRDRDDVLQALSVIIGREVESTTTLTTVEASHAIDFITEASHDVDPTNALATALQRVKEARG